MSEMFMLGTIPTCHVCNGYFTVMASPSSEDLSCVMDRHCRGLNLQTWVASTEIYLLGHQPE